MFYEAIWRRRTCDHMVEPAADASLCGQMKRSDPFVKVGALTSFEDFEVAKCSTCSRCLAIAADRQAESLEELRELNEGAA